MQSIDLGEALSLWFSGQKLDGMALYGLSIVWWARIATIVTYVAGLTVILDIVGPEKLRELGARTRGSARFRFYSFLVPAALVIMILFIVLNDGLALIISMLVLLPLYVLVRQNYREQVVIAVARVFENTTTQRPIRVASVGLLLLAFLVDLLTS